MQGGEEALGEGREVPGHRRGTGRRGAGAGARRRVDSVHGFGLILPVSMASALTEWPGSQ